MFILFSFAFCGRMWVRGDIMNFIKTIDIEQLLNTGCVLTAEDYMEDRNTDFITESVMTMSLNDKSIFIFPIDINKSVDDYHRFVPSLSKNNAIYFYHGFVSYDSSGFVFSVLSEDFFPSGTVYKNRENEMEELKKDDEAIQRVLMKTIDESINEDNED